MQNVTDKVRLLIMQERNLVQNIGNSCCVLRKPNRLEKIWVLLFASALVENTVQCAKHCDYLRLAWICGEYLRFRMGEGDEGGTAFFLRGEGRN